MRLGDQHAFFGSHEPLLMNKRELSRSPSSKQCQSRSRSRSRSPQKRKLNGSPSKNGLVDPLSRSSPPRSPTAIQKAIAHSQVKSSIWTIWYAAQYGKIDRIRSILDRKIVPSIDVQEYRTKWTALHFSARFGQVQIVQLLLERGADPDLRDLAGNSPLHLSAGWGNLRCTVLLLEAGAQAALQNHRGQTPLDIAGALGRQEQLRVLTSWQPLGLTPEELQAVRASRSFQLPLDPLEARVAGLQSLELELQEEDDPFIRQELHALHAKTQEHGDHHASVLETLARLCSAYQSTNCLEKALAVAERAVTLAEELYGREHAMTLAWLNNTSELLLALDRTDESEQFLEETYAAFETANGPCDTATLLVLENLAVVLVTRQRLPEAEAHLRELLQRLRSVYDGGWNDRVFELTMQLGVAVFGQTRVAEAQAIFQECLSRAHTLYGESHVHTIACIEQLGRCGFLLGEFEDSERLFQQSLRLALALGVRFDAAHHRRLHNNLAMLAIARRSANVVQRKLQASNYRSKTGPDPSSCNTAAT